MKGRRKQKEKQTEMKREQETETGKERIACGVPIALFKSIDPTMLEISIFELLGH